ncbi:MAG: formate dehydrogenase accessory sulfurtransferase FdhD [Mycobacteriales bacterium]
MGRITTRRRVLRVGGARPGWADDRVVAEEPLEIRLGGHTLAVTMRTPGHDLELALGYCLSEGLVRKPSQVSAIRNCAADTVEVSLAPGTAVSEAALSAATRLTTTTSACGLCGAASVDAVRRDAPYDVLADPLQVDAALLGRLPETLREAQRVFDRTGGLHAAGLFDAGGALLVTREDVGRHNALDKVIGWAAAAQLLPLSGHLLLVSGRASFELVQKAVMAGAPLLAAVSAPSALAVTLAEEAGLTLVGFLRAASMNVYTHPQRIRLD